MPTSAVNIRMDSEVKKEFETICNGIGLNITTAINVFAKKVIMDRKIPFELTADATDPFYSKENMVALAKAKQDFEGDRKHFVKFNPESR